MRLKLAPLCPITRRQLPNPRVLMKLKITLLSLVVAGSIGLLVPATASAGYGITGVGFDFTPGAQLPNIYYGVRPNPPVAQDDVTPAPVEERGGTPLPELSEEDLATASVAAVLTKVGTTKFKLRQLECVHESGHVGGCAFVMTAKKRTYAATSAVAVGGTEDGSTVYMAVVADVRSQPSNCGRQRRGRCKPTRQKFAGVFDVTGLI
jgi:hypothetical protein